MVGKATDISGMTHGYLLALRMLDKVNRSGQKLWEFKCMAPARDGICGQLVTLPSADVIRGHNISCGCQRRAQQARYKAIAYQYASRGRRNA